MNFYRRAGFASNTFRNLSSRIVTRAPVQEPTSRILQNGSSSTAKFSGFSSYSCFSKRLGFSVGTASKNYCNSVNDIIIGKRYYSLDRYWLENLTYVLVAFGAAITFYLRHLETVPYTNRTRFVIMLKDLEKRIGEYRFQEKKASYKDKILPATHPDSVLVMLILKGIIEALQRGLSLENVGSVRYVSSESDEGRAHDTLTEGGEGRIEGKLSKEDEILHTRKKGQEKWLQATTSHLEGLNWEVMVVNKPDIAAFFIPGGKIVVFTGLLEHFGTDEELATIFGHEVGHAVARHGPEQLTRKLLPIDTISTLLFKQPFSWNRKIELEADYIGLMLLASAGYDPRVAPKALEKLDQFAGDKIYPSAKERAQLLAQPKVMEEALSIYRETRSGYGVKGFL